MVGNFLTCGGVGVVVDLPPDIISSVISRPPWLGSRILIYQETRQLLVQFPQNTHPISKYKEHVMSLSLLIYSSSPS